MSVEKLLTEDEVMAHLSVSRATLYRLRKDAGFPHQKVGEKLVRYRMSEVENWMKTYVAPVSVLKNQEDFTEEAATEENSQVPAAQPRAAAIFKPKSGVFMK